jgi:hypothetical protein
MLGLFTFRAPNSAFPIRLPCREGTGVNVSVLGSNRIVLDPDHLSYVIQ